MCLCSLLPLKTLKKNKQNRGIHIEKNEDEELESQISSMVDLVSLRTDLSFIKDIYKGIIVKINGNAYIKKKKDTQYDYEDLEKKNTVIEIETSEENKNEGEEPESQIPSIIMNSCR